MSQYLIVFSKVNIDKVKGLSSGGIFYGGIANNKEEIDLISKNCNKIARVGTAVISIVNYDYDMAESIKEGTKRLEDKLKHMNSDYMTTIRPRKKK